MFVVFEFLFARFKKIVIEKKFHTSSAKIQKRQPHTMCDKQ